MPVIFALPLAFGGAAWLSNALGLWVPLDQKETIGTPAQPDWTTASGAMISDTGDSLYSALGGKETISSALQFVSPSYWFPNLTSGMRLLTFGLVLFATGYALKEAGAFASIFRGAR